jgi:hypothetical protein
MRQEKSLACDGQTQSTLVDGRVDRWKLCLLQPDVGQTH